MCVRYCELWIQFDRTSIGMFCFTVRESTRLQCDAETIPANRILRIDLNRTSRELLSIGKSLSIVSAGAWLHEHHTQRDIRVGIIRRPRDGISIRSLSLFPTLLIGIDVAQAISSARVAWFEVQDFFVSSFSVGIFFRITGLVALVQ